MDSKQVILPNLIFHLNVAGCAFVTYANRQSALNAIKNMHHSQTMEVRTIRCNGGITKGQPHHRPHKGAKGVAMHVPCD